MATLPLKVGGVVARTVRLASAFVALKAEVLIIVTVDGKTSVLRAVQLWNAPVLISLIPSGSITDVSREQPVNIVYPSCVGVAGSLIDCK